MTDNPMIADNQPQTYSAVPGTAADDLGARNLVGPDALEGAGPVSGFASAVQNLARGDLPSATTDVIGVGFDALGVIQDPMRACFAAGIGWLIEHVSIANEILSVMAGDPSHVADHAQTWTNIGDHVKARAQALQDSVDKLAGTSHAVDGYRIAVNDFAKAVDMSGQAAYAAADSTNTAATVVATTRSVIRDWFADWAAGRVMAWAGIAPLTPVTFGAAQAAFITESLVSGTRVAVRATKELRTLVKHLDDLAAAAKAGSRSLTDAAAALRKAADGTTSAAGATRAARLLGATSPGVYDGKLFSRMNNLHDDAVKHVDAVGDATADAAAAAARRAETGKLLGSRKAPPKGRVTEAAHAAAKRAQKSADSRVATHTNALARVNDEAREIAADAGRLNRRVADDVAAATRDRLSELGERAFGAGMQTAKEAVVQTSNEDMRAENARKGYVDQYTEHHGHEPPGRDAPTATQHDENDEPRTVPRTGPPTPGGAGQPPSEPTVTTTGPAPQPVRQETWQVRGTLDD